MYNVWAALPQPFLLFSLLAASAAPIWALWRSLGYLLAIGLAAAVVAAWIGGLLSRRQAGLPPADHFPCRSHYLALAVSFTFFVVYGSLLPFEYTPLGIHEAIDRFCHVPLLELSAGQERADWLGTILFFVPVGFCGWPLWRWTNGDEPFRCWRPPSWRPARRS